MPRSLTLEDVKIKLSNKGLTFIDGYYVNKHNSRIVAECINGHRLERSWEDIRQLKGCPECNKLNLRGNDKHSSKFLLDIPIDRPRAKKYTNQEISSLLQMFGYELLSAYKNVKHPIRLQCPEGHIFMTTWDRCINHKQGCPICNPNGLLNWDRIRHNLHLHGITLIQHPDNSDFLEGEIEVRCSKGHTYKTTYQNIRGISYKCRECAHNNSIKSDKEIVAYIESNGYELVDKYIKSDIKMSLRCPQGHLYKTTWDNFYYNDRRCPRCGVGTSRLEKKLIADVEGMSSNIVLHDRHLLKPRELDIVIPEKRLAIELCGLYWHSEWHGKKDSRYHQKKLEDCLAKNYTLVTIFEDEYVYKRPIVLSRLRSILGIVNNRVYARNCIIKEITKTEAGTFLDQHHIQGSSYNTKYCLGAIYKGCLYAVMTFSGGNISRSFKAQEGVWELDRFCVHKDYVVVGVASKLLTYFERRYKWKSIISFADRRWSTGSLYYRLGFEFVGKTKPSYYYFEFNKISPKRKHRYTLRKKKDEPKHITEFELRRAQGYDRIWDCGSLKFIKENQKWEQK